MSWLLAATMAGLVGLALGWPFLRARARSAAPAAAYDRAVYAAQLEEVARDAARGVVSTEDAARLRVEIGRRLLDADRAAGSAGATAAPPRRRAMAALGVAVMAAGFALYAALGAPGADDQPIAARLAAAQRLYDARPTQAEAEARAPRLASAPADPAYAALVEQLRAVVASRPDDRRGLALLAEHESRLGNAAAAAAAQARLVALLGADATAEDHARLAMLRVAAAGGLVTREAEDEIAAALGKDRAEPLARYLQGLLYAQMNRPDRAFPIWRDLLEQYPSAAFAGPIRGVIGELAWLAGDPAYQPPEAPQAAPGPDADALAAAAGMTEADRAQMIGGMVERLEQRLAAEGGTAEEWARLIGALHVQGRDDHAREILAEARQRFAADAAGLAAIEAAAAQAGLR